MWVNISLKIVYVFTFIDVMSKGNSIESVKMIEAFGGIVELVDQVDVRDGVSKKDTNQIFCYYGELVININNENITSFFYILNVDLDKLDLNKENLYTKEFI